MYKARGKTLVIDGKIYGLQALKSAKRCKCIFMFIQDSRVMLRESGAMEGDERQPEDYQNMQYTY